MASTLERYWFSKQEWDTARRERTLPPASLLAQVKQQLLRSCEAGNFAAPRGELGYWVEWADLATTYLTDTFT